MLFPEAPRGHDDKGRAILDAETNLPDGTLVDLDFFSADTETETSGAVADGNIQLRVANASSGPFPRPPFASCPDAKEARQIESGDSRDANEIALTFDVAITDGDAATLNRLADGSIHPFEGWTSTGLTEPNVWVDQVRGGSGPASGHLPIDPSTRRLEGAARVAGRRPLGATATNQLQGFSSRSRIGAEHAPHCGRDGDRPGLLHAAHGHA